MLRMISGILVALLTFSIGMAVTWLCFILLFPTIRLVEPVKVNQPQQPFIERLELKPMASSCDVGEARVYETPEGEILIESVNIYPSAADANRELQNRVKDALEIIEHKIDYREGRKIGEMIVAIFAQEGLCKQRVRVLWAEGEKLQIINAPTLELALDLANSGRGVI